MPTYSSDLLPSSTGIKLGSNSQRWDAFIQNLDVSGTMTGGIPLYSNIASIRIADQFPGADWAAKVSNASVDLGGVAGEIWVSQAAIPGSCATPPVIAPHQTLRFVQGGVYVLSGTFKPPVGSRIIGVGDNSHLNSFTFGSPIPTTGTILRYTGGVANTPVIQILADNVTIEYMTVDGSAASGTVGYLYQNTSGGTQGVSGLSLHRCAAFRCFQGFVNGDPTTAIAGGAGSVGFDEADSFTIDYLGVYGITGGTGGNSSTNDDEAVHVNCANGGQQSSIKNVFAQGMNVGLNFVRTNGGISVENDNSGGSMQGVTPDQVRIQANASHPIGLRNCESEGSTMTHSVHDSSNTAGIPGALWQNNQFFGGAGVGTDVLIDGNANITSINNSGVVGGFFASGNSLITTINDKILWNIGSNGKVLNLSTYGTARKDLTGQTAAIGSTLLYTAFNPQNVGQYQVSWDAKVTTPATTGAGTSTLGPLTITYVDRDGVTQTITCAAQVAAGTIATTSAGNSTTTVLLGQPILLNLRDGSQVNFTFGYASDTAAQMAYNLHIYLEAKW